MSNEIKLSMSLRVANGDAKLNWTPGTLQFDQEQAAKYERIFELDTDTVFDTTETGLDAHKLVIVRFIELLGGSGETGSVRVYPTNGSEFFDIDEGEVCMFKSDDFKLGITDDPANVEVIVVAV